MRLLRRLECRIRSTAGSGSLTTPATADSVTCYYALCGLHLREARVPCQFPACVADGPPSGRIMRASHSSAATMRLIGGRVCLDFVNTVGGRNALVLGDKLGDYS